MNTYDLIIVGQGLAGSVLAMKLIENGFSVIVIDKPELSSCSKVAAGIWNPVVFKRSSKSWKADEVLPEMISFYRKTGKELGVELITERNIIKLFSEEQEIALWKKKAKGELRSYLDENIYTQAISGINNTALGYSKVLKAGNLHVNLFLDAVRDHLTKKGSYLNEKFDHGALKVGEEIKYKDINAKGIIFAEGYLIKNNPFFNYVPMKPAKGEVLTLELDKSLDTSDVINKSGFLLPLGGNRYKAGATYNWENLDDNATPGGLKELQVKIGKMTSSEYKVIKQEGGVRPSVIDRRPVMGVHPKYKAVYLFNGMGTKGVMLAPYFAQQMTEFIKTGKSLDPEVNLSRFNRFFVN
jgi:glycine oxidase